MPTVEAIPTSCGAPITGIAFSETFPGNAIDTNKWDVFGAGAGGTITVTPGTAVFTVAGDVLAMQTKNNPIPPSGDFSMYCKGKIYASNVSHGSICATQGNAIPTYAGYDSGSLWQVGARYGNMFEYMVASVGPPGPILFSDNIPQDINSTHEYELCVRGETVERFRDGVSLGSVALPQGWIRPKFIHIGNPGSPGAPFTNLETNAIEVRTLASSVAPGLVGYWNFNDCTANDSSGLSNSGTLVGAPTCVAGSSGSGMRFNSTNYAEIPDSASLDLTSAFTISTWFKADALTPNFSLRLVDKTNAGSGDGYAITVWSGGLSQPSGGSGAIATVPISSGVFHHAALTFNQGTARFFLDGQFVGTGNIGATSVSVNALPLRIGASQGANATPNANFSGVIDEVRIYNRTLSDVEVAALATAPATVSGTCGTADGVAVATAPTANLCATGTANPTTPTGPGPWSWTCNGSGGGTNDSCSAPLLGPECVGSTVSTITHVDLTASMTAVNAVQYGKFRQTFNATCANGRFGVVRLPGINLAGIIAAGEAYALVQSACATKPVQKMASPPATSAQISTAMAVKNNQSALLADPLVGPLAAWVCQ